jgi:hypothetical protein
MRRLDADSFSATWALLRRQPNDERDDGVAHGWQAWLRWWSIDSFLPSRFCEAAMLEECVSNHRHERVPMKTLPEPSLEVGEAEFFLQLLMGLLADPSCFDRGWALPFLTILAPSERYNTAHGRHHKKLTDWARQAILQVPRWVPKREVVVVADSSFSALDLIAAVRHHVCLITRLRLDASLFEPAPERRPGQNGRPAKKGQRLPKLSEVLADKKTHWTRSPILYWYGHERCFLDTATGTAVWYHSGLAPAPIRWVLVRDPTGVRDTQAFLCTNLDATPMHILGWFVSRGSIETTFQESRAHLGVEMQRQWSDIAIARTTPALFGLFSLVALWASDPKIAASLRPRSAARYCKRQPSFSDAIAAVRRAHWSAPGFSMSRHRADSVEIPTALMERLTDALCYAA